MLSITSGQTNKAAYLSLKTLNARTRLGIDRAFRMEQPELLKDTTDGFEEPKSGNVYRVYRDIGGRKLKRGRLHQASAKNETPAVLTGALRKSLGFTMRKGSSMTYGANTPYARRWERSPRSYLLKSIKRRQMHLWHSLESCIRREITKNK